MQIRLQQTIVDCPKAAVILVKAVNQETTGVLLVVNSLCYLVFEGLLSLDDLDDLFFDLFAEFKDLLHSEAGLAHLLLGSSLGQVADMRVSSLLDSHDLVDRSGALGHDGRVLVVCLWLSLVLR